MTEQWQHKLLRIRVAVGGLIFLLLALTGTKIYSKYSQLVLLSNAGAVAAHRYHELKFDGILGQTIVVDSVAGRFQAPIRESSIHRLVEIPALSPPVLLDVPFPSPGVLTVIQDLDHLIQLSARTENGSVRPVLSDFVLSGNERSLRFLRLNMPPGPNDPRFIRKLSDFSKLEVIWLPQSHCNDSAILSLTALEELRALAVSGEAVTDKSWRSFAAMPSLRLLGIGPSNMTLDAAKQFVTERDTDFCLFTVGTQIQKRNGRVKITTTSDSQLSRKTER